MQKVRSNSTYVVKVTAAFSLIEKNGVIVLLEALDEVLEWNYSDSQCWLTDSRQESKQRERRCLRVTDWLTGEDVDDPAALYGSEHMAVGQPAWYSIDGYSYGINDWRGNAVAENQRRQRPNDIPLDDVMPQTGNGSAIPTETTTATTATTTTAQTSRLTELLVYSLIDLYHKVVYLYSWA